MKDIGVMEWNKVHKENAGKNIILFINIDSQNNIKEIINKDEPQHLDSNIIDNIHAEEGKFTNKVNPNGESRTESFLTW